MTRDPKHADYEEAQFAWRLVGEFFFHWAYLEMAVTVAVRKLYDLRGTEADMLLANVQFRDKLAMMATILNWYSTHKPQEWTTKLSKLIRDIADFNTNYRNVLAHNPFAPIAKSDGGGINIFRTLAKKKFSIPKTVWSEQDFERRFSEINDLEKRLEEFVKDIAPRAKIVRAMLQKPNPWPTRDTLSLGSLGLPPLLPLKIPGLLQTPAIPETNAQTPHTPGEKE
jgi:hypothetical protein